MAVPSTGSVGVSDMVSALGITSGGPYSYMGTAAPATTGSLVRQGRVFGQLSQLAAFSSWQGQAFTTQNGLVFFMTGRASESYSGSGSSIIDVKTTNVGSKGSSCTYSGSYQGYFGITSNSNGYISFGHTPTYSCNGQVTIMAWVNPNTANYLFLACKGPSNGAASNYPGNYELRITPSGGVEALYQVNNANNNYRMFSTANGVAPIGGLSWYHIAAVIGGDSNGVTIYVDGVAKSTTPYGTVGNPIATNTQPLYIGYRSDNFYCTGNISNVAIYNRLLTASEVTDGFNSLKTNFK